MNEVVKRQYLIKIVVYHLETSKALMEYLRANAETKEGKEVCTKSIKEISLAIQRVYKVKHTEILEYLYGMFVGNNAIAYSVSGKIVNSKTLKYYDTQKGLKEFKQKIAEQKQEELDREQKRKDSVEALKKAKEMGKKVEMVYDKDTKSAKPMIVEDKDNA